MPKIESSKGEKTLNTKAQSKVYSKNEPPKREPPRKPVKQEHPKMKSTVRPQAKLNSGQGIETPVFRE